MDGVLSVFPSGIRKLHTTRSWDYLGFPLTVKRSRRESNVIIGLLDTGIWPSSPSFDDKGMGPPPRKWRGKCESSHNFTCNNKIIGARSYSLDKENMPSSEGASPLDDEGHGTHTASIAGGATVAHANLYGLGDGMARGATPSARIAMYKVCWFGGCSEMDMLAAFDQAIHDGVDIISVSLGSSPLDYLSDVLAIGSFHAMRRGILTCLSGGNDGPALSSVSNVSPWAITVAASATDRQFRTVVGLGDGRKVLGISLNTFEPSRKLYPLIAGKDAAFDGDENGNFAASFCEEDYLDPKKVKGKIVYCEPGTNPEGNVASVGGVGVIKHGEGMLMDVALTYGLPSSTINEKVTAIVTSYMNSTRNPMAVIYKSIAVNVSKPVTASFSSRGPNPISSNILKPDISAPGLDILAAWSNMAPLSDSGTDERRSNYNIISGTSMSCPHVSGLAAYIKSFHPHWSPAAIKSAIMTTAKDMSIWDKKDVTELGYGSGLIDPLRAIDPGLVYDMDEASYIRFLCKEGYNATMIAFLQGTNKTTAVCPSAAAMRRLGSDALNYPSMQQTVRYDSDPVLAVFRRTLTNVGPPRSVYRVSVRAPKGMSISVRPSKLVFSETRRRRSFKVVVKGMPLWNPGVVMVSASLTWEDGKHTVRSPIVVLKPVSFD